MEQINFSSMDLSREVKKAIAKMGFEAPTPIQQEAIPMILDGYDVIAKSHTGTGKTLAFSVPAIEIVKRTIEQRAVKVLVLCPTRELAQQNYDQMKKLTLYTPAIETACLYGGASMTKQFDELKNAKIVIGTPGRILDHIKRKTLSLAKTELVVLDEADEMLSMGFQEELEAILNSAPKTRQTVLFSATMSPEIVDIASQHLKDAKSIATKEEHPTAKNITQLFVDAPRGRKKDTLLLLMKYFNPRLAIIFCNTKKMVDELTELLYSNGFSAQAIHGDLGQNQRTKVMQDFKSYKTTLLIATDVAARGIDVNDIEYIINYDIPQSVEYYVHRIGRTARAGKEGTAITLTSGNRQIETMKDVSREIGVKIKRINIPTPTEIKSKSFDKIAEEVSFVIDSADIKVLDEVYNKLLKEGYSPENIAKASLTMKYENALGELKEVKPEYKKNTDGYTSPKRRKDSKEQYRRKPFAKKDASKTNEGKRKPYKKDENKKREAQPKDGFIPKRKKIKKLKTPNL